VRPSHTVGIEVAGEHSSVRLRAPGLGRPSGRRSPGCRRTRSSAASDGSRQPRDVVGTRQLDRLAHQPAEVSSARSATVSSGCSPA
jgi:hypothetical protein